MFSLSPADLQVHILGCGDGPASFQAEARASGHSVLSCDPLYQFSAVEIESRVHATYSVVLDQVCRNRDQFVWEHLSSPEHLGEIRLRAMRHFLSDYPQGKEEGRYCAEALPRLSFEDQAFGLALCSHFLFLYSEQLGLDFHLAAVRELCRVAAEVRIFPLLSLDGALSPHVRPVMEALEERGYSARRVKVAYEFQKGGNEMLQIMHRSGVV